METTNATPLPNDKMMNSDPTVPKSEKGLRIIVNISHSIVLILSVALIVYISYDTFKIIPFLEDHTYMTFQFWVCVVFLADFFLEFLISHDKGYYLRRRWLFFIIAIPYLNIINQFDIHFSNQILFFLRFVPLLRGAYSLAMVIGYISRDRAASLMWQYLAILFTLVYSLSLIFFYEEHGINSNVKTFWDALYWAAMNTTTVGCYFSAITPVGKIISVVLPTAGMLMLPLFTAFVTSKVRDYDSRRERIEYMFEARHRKKMMEEANANGTNPAAATQDAASPVPTQDASTPAPALADPDATSATAPAPDANADASNPS